MLENCGKTETLYEVPKKDSLLFFNVRSGMLHKNFNTCRIITYVAQKRINYITLAYSLLIFLQHP